MLSHFVLTNTRRGFLKLNNLFFHHNFTLADFWHYIAGLSKTITKFMKKKRQNCHPRNSTGQHSHSRTYFSVAALVLLFLYCVMMQQFYCLPPIKNNQYTLRDNLMTKSSLVPVFSSIYWLKPQSKC